MNLLLRNTDVFAGMKYAGFLLLFTVLFVAGLSAQGTIRGTVKDPSGEPIVGAAVVLPDVPAGAYTNTEGVFSISNVPAGEHEVRVTYIGYDTATSQVTVITNQSVTLNFTIRESSSYLETVEIIDQQVGEIEKTEVLSGITRVTPKEINMLPSLGAPDLAQYLQVLPGVVFTGDQGGQLYIRGGTPAMNMVLLDGAIIYQPFHSIGLFSVFDPDYIRTIDVYSAAFPAQYGGRISSMMDIRTRNGDMTGYHGKFNVNPITAGALVEGPLKKNTSGGGSSFLISARKSYLDKTSLSLYEYVNDTIGLPYSFTDFYGKLTFMDGGNYINLFGFVQDDDVNYDFPANYTWTSYGGGTNFMFLPATANSIISGNFAWSSMQSGLQNTVENFPRESGISGFNGGLNFNYIINNVDELNYGVTILGFKTNYKFTNSFGLITERVDENTELAGYFRYKFVVGKRDNVAADDKQRFTERAVIEPGVHIHYYNDHGISLEPRFRGKINFDKWSINLGAGMYTQNLMSATSDRDVVNLFTGYLSAPQNVAGQIRGDALQASIHYLAGVEAELVPHLTTTVEGWYKDFTQLTNINRDKLFPEDPDFITETGKAYGVDLILKYQHKNMYAYANYGLAKVTRDDNIRTYPPVFDRRHNANVVLSWTPGTLYPKDGQYNGARKFTEKKWEFSLRWNLGSGFPFTLTQGFFEKLDFTGNGAQTNYLNQNGSLGILYDDEVNAGRLPYYHRLDISVKRRWLLKYKLLLEASANIINVYNRDNIFYFDRVRYETVYQLPLMPTLGLTVKF